MSANWLDQLVGDWNFQSRGLPDVPEARREGSETVRRQGAWLVIESGRDYRFQLALDPGTGKVTGDFVHWAHPQFWLYEVS